MTDGDENKPAIKPEGDEGTKKTPEARETSKDEGKANSPILEEADRINKEKAALIEREEKLQERKEKMWAEQKVSGRAGAGYAEAGTKEETAKEYADRVMKNKSEIKDGGN